MNLYLKNAVRTVLCRLSGTYYFDDVLEKAALLNPPHLALRSIFHTRIPNKILERKVLFVHIPKNAGTSICSALYGGPVGHHSIRYYSAINPSLTGSITSFAIFREPVDRFLSSFSFVVNGGGDMVRLEASILSETRHIQTIDDYLDFLESRRSDIFKLDNVMRPQKWYVSDRLFSEVIVKNLFVLGAHDQSLRQFLGQYGVADLPTLNRAPRLQSELTSSQARRVQRLYAADFELFDQLMTQGPKIA